MGVVLSQNSTPLCSVIVPVYNNCFYTRLCLEALAKARTGSPPYELILVDNGSIDDTASVLAQFSADLSSVIRNQANLGFAAAANQGAAVARGEYLVFLNNDVMVEAGWLGALVAAAREDGEVGAVGARLLYPDGTIQHAGVVFGPDRHPHHAFAGYPGDWPGALTARDYQAVTGACLLVGKELFLSLGGFDESYSNSFEDVDLCLKIRRSGRRVLYCSQAVAYHFESSTPGRFLRDDRNLSLLLSRWGEAIVSDADPAKEPLRAGKGSASLMRLELEALAARARRLATESAHLRRLLADAERQSARVESLPYDLAYRPDRPASTLAGSVVSVPVALVNQGHRAWPPGHLRLSYHWRRAGAPYDCLVWDGLRTVVEEALEPGQAVSLSAAVLMPEASGSYVLEWDAVEEGVAWMSERGVVPYRQLVVVHRAAKAVARVEGLPAWANAGDLVEVTSQFERRGDSWYGWGPSLAWRWVSLDGQGDQGPCPLEDRRTLRGGDEPLRFALRVPGRPGRYRLEIGQLSPDGSWLPVETLGGQLGVLAGPETDSPSEAEVPASGLGQEAGGDTPLFEAMGWQRLAEEDGYWLARAQVERERELGVQLKEERLRVAQLEEMVVGYRRGKVMRLLAFFHRLPFLSGRG